MKNTTEQELKLWGGRFSQGTHQAVEAYTSSLALDSRLWKVDIKGSIAHARMLGRQGILATQETNTIIQALLQIHEELSTHQLEIDSKSEDIHSDIEKKLNAKIGALSGKLHTARSRNDQVATDTRLYLCEEVNNIQAALLALQTELIQISEKHEFSILPGLTHMQHAQPVSLAHHLMAYFWMFERDKQRLSDSLKRTLSMPLGSAALAGTGFNLDRTATQSELGFTSISENSLDAVSDRDFVIEFLSNGSMIMMHLSKLADELILWSMPEFQFVELSDRVTTGSSIMPQKKNPDVAELIRGRVGRLYGALMGILTTMKALPLAYNRDYQEDKYYLFEGIDTVFSSIQLMHLMLQEAQFSPEKMKEKLSGDFSNATDLADDLVEKGLPFRQAHEVVGNVVKYCLENQLKLEELDLQTLKKFSQLIDADIINKLKHEAVLMARRSFGGTSPEAVRNQIARARLLTL